MKKHINIILLLSITILTINLSSCKKSKESKIIGTWEETPLNNVDNVNQIFYWTFDAGSKLTVEIKNQDTTLTFTGTYNIVSKNIGFSGYMVVIDELNIKTHDYSYDLTGKYKIFKLTNDKMQLHRESFINGDREGAFLWKDFIKQ